MSSYDTRIQLALADLSARIAAIVLGSSAGAFAASSSDPGQRERGRRYLDQLASESLASVDKMLADLEGLRDRAGHEYPLLADSIETLKRQAEAARSLLVAGDSDDD